MILQKIVWNQQSVEEPELYYKLKNGIKSESGILLNAGGEADFLTYMNIFLLKNGESIQVFNRFVCLLILKEK